MYQPPHFRIADQDELASVMRANPLGLLITHGPSGLMANPVPFLFDGGESPRLRAHLARANPQLAEIGEAGADVLVVFQAENAYVTPAWYETKRETGKVVPTWNYVMVQARGRATLRPSADWMRGQIDELTATHEKGRAQEWAVSDAPADFLAAQMKGIVGLEIAVTKLEGKFKLSQNRNDADRAGVVEGLAAEASADAQAMAQRLRKLAERG